MVFLWAQALEQSSETGGEEHCKLGQWHALRTEQVAEAAARTSGQNVSCKGSEALSSKDTTGVSGATWMKIGRCWPQGLQKQAVSSS